VSLKSAPWQIAAALAILAVVAIIALPPILASIAGADDSQPGPQTFAPPERLEDLAGSIEPVRTFPTQDADAFWQTHASVSDDLSDLAAGPLAAASASEAARQAELAEPSSQAEREASASTLVGASPQEAKAAINQNFGDIIETASSTPLDALGTSEVAFFRGEQVAVLEGAGGKPASLAVSTTPMRVPGENGRLAPIDLGLTLEGGSWSTTNGQVELQIPTSSAGTFEVGPLAFDLALPGEQPSSSSSLGDSARFYPEVGPDTDMALSATSEGAEVFFSLRSPASPETQTLQMDIPAGAQLTETATGSFEVVSGETIIARIPVPVAFDSDRTSVPVQASVDGTALTLTTEHRGQDLAYPILVDPIIDTIGSSAPSVRRLSEVVDSEGNLIMPYGGWYAADFGEPLDNYAASGAFGDGLYLEDPVASTRHGGLWVWIPPPGSTELTQVDFGPYGLALNGDTSSAGGALILGTLTDDGQAGQVYTEDVSNGYTTVYPANGEGNPSTNDLAFFGLFRIKFGSIVGDNDHSAYLGGAVAHLSDPDGAGARLTGELGEMGTQTIDTGWTNNSATMTVPMEATDSGLGVKKLEAVAVDENDDTVVLGSYVDPCQGGPGSPCPETLARDVDLDMSLMDEGRYTLKFRAYDALLRTAGGPNLELGVDRTEPTLAELAGELKDLENIYTASTSTVDLTASAADDSAQENSGLDLISVAEEGGTWGTQVSCSEVDCSQQEFDVPLASLGDGNTVVSVEARDRAGNVSARGIPLNLDRTAPQLAVLTPRDPEGVAWDSGESLDFEVSIVDLPVSGEGIAEYSVEVDGEPVSPEPCETDCSIRTFTVPETTAGTYTVTVEASDFLGNTEQDSVEITLDPTSPVIDLAGELQDGATIGAGEKSIEVDVSDPQSSDSQSGPAQVTMMVDGEVLGGSTADCLGPECALSETYAYAEDELPLGQHTIRITAYDWAGNSTSEDVTVRRTCDVPAPFLITTVDPISTAAAIATVESEHPEVVASSDTVEIDGREFTPTLEEQGQVLRGADTAQPSQIPESPDGSMVVGTGDQAVCLVPTSRGQHAGEATIVNGDSALYANTAQDVDSVVRPTVEGTEEFSILRSGEAPESFSWSIASAQDHSVRSTQSGALSVELPASDLAVPENPGTISATEAQTFDLPVLQDLPPSTQFVNPENGADSRDAIRDIAATEPAPSAVAALLPESDPDVAGTPPPSGDPDAAAVQQALAEAEQGITDARSEVVAQADDAFEASETSAIAEAEVHAANVASQAADNIQAQDLRIAQIDAPVATDAEGASVPLSLSSSGDQISVTVPHRGEGFEYPIAVDPIVETEAWEIDWEPFPVYREETYVSGQELTLKQVGWWDAKNCRSVSCAPDTKAGWYKVPGKLVTWLPAGPTSATVGPLYTAVPTPIFATRQVLDRWEYKPVLRRVQVSGSGTCPVHVETGIGENILWGDAVICKRWTNRISYILNKPAAAGVIGFTAGLMCRAIGKGLVKNSLCAGVAAYITTDNAGFFKRARNQGKCVRVSAALRKGRPWWAPEWTPPWTVSVRRDITGLWCS
jgi:hypothetical protein